MATSLLLLETGDTLLLEDGSSFLLESDTTTVAASAKYSAEHALALELMQNLPDLSDLHQLATDLLTEFGQ